MRREGCDRKRMQEKQKNCDNSRRSNVENGYVSKLLTGRLYLAQKNQKIGLPKRIFGKNVEIHSHDILHREEKA